MSLKSLFRVGIPRVTETISRFGCGRDTGGLGTGVYAYSDLDIAKKNSMVVSGKQPIFEIDVSEMCKNPLKIEEDLFGSDLTTRSLNKAGIAMRCKNIDEATERLTWIPGIMKAVSEKTSCGDEYDFKCEQELKSLVKSSIKKERDCSKYKGKETWGAEYCSQAMNHLLQDLGFDCVLPTDRAGGNSNYLGSVILKESVDKKLGIKTIEGKDIHNFGKKLE
ncbi:hypothetical protein KKH23_05190 [Patescibacteria group bacterium]|nr:hypothetical protein [Patescibacteria group bacterium]MBU0846564.1 hypothetical protein [Patescibacteria group bacterium]